MNYSENDKQYHIQVGEGNGIDFLYRKLWRVVYLSLEGDIGFSIWMYMGIGRPCICSMASQ